MCDNTQEKCRVILQYGTGTVLPSGVVCIDHSAGSCSRFQSDSTVLYEPHEMLGMGGGWKVRHEIYQH